MQEDVHLFCSAYPTLRWDGSDAAPRVHTTADIHIVVEEEKSQGFSSFNSFDSEAAKDFVIKVRPSDKAGSSSGSSKRAPEGDLEARLVLPPKKRRTAEDVPPLIITFEKGQDPKDQALISEFHTAMSTQYDIGGLQVVGEEIEAEETTTEVVQQELPVMVEVIEIEDDEGPPIARVNLVSAQTTQEVETVAKASEDQTVIQQAAPKKLSPTLKPMRLAGKPSLNIKRSTK